MSTMSEWAKREVEIACKRENPNWDGETFDYGCSCYMSALKAYNCLMEDGHSGYSFSVTRSILEKLMNGQPLTPITDDDFKNPEHGESDEFLRDAQLKSSIQCPRMSSLFRQEDLDGNVTYHDVDRVICVNAECPSDTYGCGLSRIVDNMYPITMPYVSAKNPYKLYIETFLTDDANGDYDTEHVIGCETPTGEFIPMNIWKHEMDGETKDISDNPELIEKVKGARIDTLPDKIYNNIARDIVEENVPEDLWRTDPYEDKRLTKEFFMIVDKYEDRIRQYSTVLLRRDERGIATLNTWHIIRVLTCRDESRFEEAVAMRQEIAELSPLRSLVTEIHKEIEALLKK